MISSSGKYTYGQNNVSILWPTPGVKLEVGSFCSLAANITVYLGGNHNTNWVSTYPFGHIHESTFNTFNGTGHPSTKGDVIIGNDVWIGSNVIIMSGVTVGDGSIITNNSHVVKNVAPYSIVGGNPAKLIKLRFTEEQIASMLKIKWWEWDDEKVNKFAPLLCNPDIDNFIKLATLSYN